MKRVLLLNLPFDRPVQRDYLCPHGTKAAYYWPPIDLLLFGAAVREDARLDYVDAIAGRLTRPAALAAVRRSGADAVFTVLSSITLASDLTFLADVRRSLPGVRIWASGDVVSFGTECADAVDFRVKDLTNKEEILTHLRDDSSGGVVHEARQPEWSVGVCPHELTRSHRYAMPYSLHGGITCVSTNYGCPFPCTFCNSNAMPFKRRALGEVVEELATVERLGIREVLFRDFTLNASNVDTLCAEILHRKIRLKWSCWTSASLVDEHVLAKMKAAGCYLISYGVESGEDRVLREMRRPVDTRTIRRAVELTRRAGIEVLTSFILGYPGEDRKSTAALLFDLDPDYLSLNLLAPRLGSALRKRNGAAGAGAATDSLLSPDPDLVKARDALERRFFLGPRRMLRYVRLAARSPYRLVAFARSAMSMARRWRGRRAG
jgi:uncharacterized radical SAM superfamily protein